MANQKTGRMHPAAAGALGVMVGAAAGAAAVALSDQNNRQRLKDTVTELRVQGSKRFSELKNQATKQFAGQKGGRKKLAETPAEE